MTCFERVETRLHPVKTSFTSVGTRLSLVKSRFSRVKRRLHLVKSCFTRMETPLNPVKTPFTRVGSRLSLVKSSFERVKTRRYRYSTRSFRGVYRDSGLASTFASVEKAPGCGTRVPRTPGSTAVNRRAAEPSAWESPPPSAQRNF